MICLSFLLRQVVREKKRTLDGIAHIFKMSCLSYIVMEVG